MIVDATNQTLGRLAAYVAKAALSTKEEIIIVNAEKSLVSGKPDMLVEEGRVKLSIKNNASPLRGPFHQRRPDRYVRRAIRGMLPYEKSRGREAFSRIMVYMGVPKEEIKKQHDVDVTKGKINPPMKPKSLANYITVGALCKELGGKY
ncbi:50S ribosomal protein L13 [uncultured archaeon]|nr:50S ribosomal protein L13 [uncultured archaeon]